MVNSKTATVGVAVVVVIGAVVVIFIYIYIYIYIYYILYITICSTSSFHTIRVAYDGRLKLEGFPVAGWRRGSSGRLTNLIPEVFYNDLLLILP